MARSLEIAREELVRLERIERIARALFEYHDAHRLAEAIARDRGGYVSQEMLDCVARLREALGIGPVTAEPARAGSWGR